MHACSLLFWGDFEHLKSWMNARETGNKAIFLCGYEYLKKAAMFLVNNSFKTSRGSYYIGIIRTGIQGVH